MSQWVRHKSGEGNKWELDAHGQSTHVWRVKALEKDYLFLYLPKSEYEPCEAPVIWEDVTDQCALGGTQEGALGIWHAGVNVIHHRITYRFRKVSGSSLAICGLKWAFVVERKKS